ncbi:hypothetical protein ATANTOWER_009447 [Ataeniobius toweri]|uniref:Uncharacterized protein n=1 Tax=Ataeniobius toweri TaxID=208326 RepID=A0ABU7BC36_9TELE|nr:hypothetical protein [Ataeniobius toweri]
MSSLHKLNICIKNLKEKCKCSHPSIQRPGNCDDSLSRKLHTSPALFLSILALPSQLWDLPPRVSSNIIQDFTYQDVPKLLFPKPHILSQATHTHNVDLRDISVNTNLYKLVSI